MARSPEERSPTGVSRVLALRLHDDGSKVEENRDVDAGERRVEVDSVFPLTEARAAFERIGGRGKRGKVVLEVGTE